MIRCTRAVIAALTLAITGGGIAALTPTAEATVAMCPVPKAVAIRTAPGSGKTIALTFDDGPGNATPAVLKILRQYGVRATFFNTGAHDKQYPEQTRSIAGEGHLVANHTYDHQYPSAVKGGWTRKYLNKQFDQTNALQKKLTGRNSCFFRPPGGFQTSGMMAEARANKMSTVMWSVDTEDWRQSSKTTKASTKSIVNRARAGYSQAHPIVLMHVNKASHESESKVTKNRSNDVAALPSIIKGYQHRGYRFVDMFGKSGLNDRYTSTSVVSGTVNVLLGTRINAVTGSVKSVSGAVSGKPVKWYTRPHGTGPWAYGGTVNTDKSGLARVSDTPVRPTDYTISFPAVRGYQASSSSGYRFINTYRPAADIPGTAITGSCTDGGKVAWSSKVVWNEPYTDTQGVVRASIDLAGWTTSEGGSVPTDSTVKVYDGSGKLLQTLARTGTVDYRSGTVFDSVNPRNGPSAPGKLNVVISTGVDGDGHAPCAVRFVQPV